MSCPDCGADVVGVAVPEGQRSDAPADAMALCTNCLRTHAAGDAGLDADAVQPADEVDFSRVDASFPGGRGGVALALVLGKLDSLALERDAIERCCEAAERAGTDVRLALDRLAAADLDPHVDLARRTEQLESLREP